MPTQHFREELLRWALVFWLLIGLPAGLVLGAQAFRWTDDAMRDAALIAHWYG